MSLVLSARTTLCNGDRMEQAEFHRRYQAYPDDVKFELIGGTIFMGSPLRRSHAQRHIQLSSILERYQNKTPGVELLDNATIILGQDSEPQPDLMLRVLSAYGGQSRETPDDYIEGAPELVVEIAQSSRAIDLHQKRSDYRRGGVREYLVFCVEEPEVYWFRFRPAGELAVDKEGVYRSRIFPGLWIDGDALLTGNRSKWLEALRLGLRSNEHEAFVRRLQDRHQKHLKTFGRKRADS